MDLRVMWQTEGVHGALYRGMRDYKGLFHKNRKGQGGSPGEIVEWRVRW